MMSSGRRSSDMSCSTMLAVSSPEASPPRDNPLDIAVHSSTGRWASHIAGRPPSYRAPTRQRLELLGDALHFFRRDLADHLIGGGIHNLDAEPLGLVVDLKARVRLGKDGGAAD